MGLKFFQTFICVAVHVGDVPAECIARVVGHDQAILYERPPEVAPRAPAIQEAVRASGNRLHDPDQQQKRLDLIKKYFNFFVQAPHRKELEEELFRYQERKYMEVNSRTAKLYSEQGNANISEHMVIDEMIQCKVCQKTQCKRKVFLLMWNNSAIIIIRKHKHVEGNNSAGLTRPLSQASQDHQIAKHLIWKALNKNSEGCAFLWEKDADYRKCMHENSCTYETKESSDNIARGLWTYHNMTPHQRQAQFGNQRNVVQTTDGGSSTMPKRQHPELGQVHRARRN